jgi:multiple sugar transport system permease protein
MDSAITIPIKTTRRNWFKQLEPALYISPAFIVLGIVLVYPLGYSLWLSMHHWTLRTFRTGVPFVGLDNYIKLFSNAEFIQSLLVTFSFVVLAIAIEFVIGMSLALLLNHDLKGKGIIRSMIFLPMMCTNVVIGLTWRLLFNYQFGVINYFIQQIGFSPVEWLSSPQVALASVIIVDVWNTTSFVALLMLAGLQSLPDEPFEAAKIDGASRVQTFFFLTLPLLRQTILVVLLWRLIDTFRIFDVVYLLTSGGPARATEMISIYIYRYGFQSFNLGFASAASFMMVFIMLLLAAIMTRFVGRSET